MVVELICGETRIPVDIIAFHSIGKHYQRVSLDVDNDISYYNAIANMAIDNSGCSMEIDGTQFLVDCRVVVLPNRKIGESKFTIRVEFKRIINFNIGEGPLR